MLTFICYPKCTTCQKAKALLDGYHAEYETRDIKTANPTYDELKTWLALSELPVRKFFNTSGQLYTSLELKDKLPTMSEDECLRLLATDGMLVKRPLLVNEYRTLVGFNHDEWEDVFTTYDRKKLDKAFDNYFNEMLELVRLRENGECSRLQELADKSPHRIRVIETRSGKTTVQNFDIQLFNSAELVLGYAANIKRTHGCRNIAVNKGMFEDSFFDLSSGLIEETAQKLAAEGFRFAIFGDFSDCASAKFHDYINESNSGGNLFFAADEDEALIKLGVTHDA
ncbi:hypothetical protein FACS1894202_01560 [Clostridia bacterium]|nr:hypothetical protein FACS1894202_01560 [Clostridia bacterium]